MTKTSARTFKAFVCTILAFFFALTMVSFPASVSALGLNKTSITVTKGYSTTLSVSGANGAKVTWSSSDKTVATVSSSGKVVGKSVGTAVISAKVSGETLKCNVKVVGGKLSFSSKEVSLESGEYKYITVRAKGSHGIKAVPADKSVVKATWVKPWDGDDIRLRLTAVGSGSTYVRVQFTKYPDVYADIKVTVGSGSAMLEVNRENITSLVGESASLIVYSDVDNMLSYTLSDSTVASVSEGQWNKGYCTYTIKGLKEGTTILTLTRKDNSAVKKTITIKVNAGGYYVVSSTPLNKTVITDTVYQWVDEATRTYKYMLLPANFDIAKRNTAIAKDAKKYSYYTVYDEAPEKSVTSDSVLKFTAKVSNQDVTRYILVPASYDKGEYNTAVASYTGKFSYYEIYNVSPAAYKLNANDSVKTWTKIVNFRNVTRYMLVPPGYDENYVNKLIEEDSGSSGDYYVVLTTKPSATAKADDKILSFTAMINNTYGTFYVVVPANYDEGRYNDIVASYQGYYDYWTIYNTKPTTMNPGDTIQQWTKIVDSKTITRYIIVPPYFDQAKLDDIKNKDLATQTSSYYVVTNSKPVKINSTDIIESWYNLNSGMKWMLLPADFSVVKKNDAIAKDMRSYDYYKMYSASPTKKAETDEVISTYHPTYGTVYMLVPQNYDQGKVNQGLAGKDVTV